MLSNNRWGGRNDPQWCSERVARMLRSGSLRNPQASTHAVVRRSANDD
jgi:hypothetical protein